MTFNIRYGTADDGAEAWPARRALVAATIRDHAPHILGLQEALRFQLDQVEADTPGYEEVGVGRDDGRTAGEYSAILVDTSRYRVIDRGTRWLSDTPDAPGSATWGNTIPRIVTFALLEDRAADALVWVYNMHLDHQSQASRERSVAYVLALITEQEHRRVTRDAMRAEVSGARPAPRTILMGDFNANESNAAYRVAAAAMTDAYRAMHPDEADVETFNGWKPSGWTSGMIDHVLLGPGWRVIDAGIDRRRFDGLWASDHFAVWAILD